MYARKFHWGCRHNGDNRCYKNTVEMVDAPAGHKLNRDQDDYLLLLSGLVERYEALIRPRMSASGARGT